MPRSRQDGANPILHITMHAAVESQIAGGEPPETAQTVAALERIGLSHHEAVHRVASVLTDEIWHMMNERRPFDPSRYTAELAKLLRFRPSQPQRTKASAKRHPQQKR